MNDLLWLGLKLSCVLVALGAALLVGRSKSASWQCTMLRLGFWTVALLPLAEIWGPRWFWRVMPVTKQDLLELAGIVPAKTEPVPVAFVAVFSIGVAVGLLRLALELARLRNVLRECVPFACAAELRFPVLVSDRVESPFTVGFARPVIVLPLSSVEWSEERLQSVLAHEHAHVRRLDWAQFIAMRLVQILLWPNLFLSWLNRQANLACEQACDDEVLREGVSGPDYARHLVSLAQSSQLPFPTAAMAAPCAIEERVRGVLVAKRERGRTPLRDRLGAVTVGLAAIIGLGGLTLAPAAFVQFLDPTAKPPFAASIKDLGAGRVLSGKELPERVFVYGRSLRFQPAREFVQIFPLNR